MESERPKDPRTREVLETFAAISVLGFFHLVCLAIGIADRSFGFSGYVEFACVILPLLSVIAASVLRSTRSWHWGQITLFIVASGMMSLLQLILVGRATAI